MKVFNQSVRALIFPVLIFLWLPVQAHHASKFFKVTEPHWINGTVLEFLYTNPHSRITLSIEDENGEHQEWIVEGPRLARMHLMGVQENFLKVGDNIRICGFLPTQELIDLSRANNGIAQRDTFIHGRLLIKQDNEKWLWGPYGDLSSCLPRQEWGSINRGEQPLPLN